MNKRLLSFLIIISLILTNFSLNVSANEVITPGYIGISVNGHKKYYSSLLNKDIIYLCLEDISEITGYEFSIGDFINYSKAGGLDSITHVDIEFDGTISAMGKTAHIEIVDYNKKKYLPLAQMLFFLHAQWCIDKSELLVRPLPSTIIDFLAIYNENIQKSKVNQTDLLINGESKLAHVIRSSLAAVFNDFDPSIFVIWWPDEGFSPFTNGQYEEALLQIAVDDIEFLKAYNQQDFISTHTENNLSLVQSDVDSAADIVNIPKNICDGLDGIDDIIDWIAEESGKESPFHFYAYGNFESFTPGRLQAWAEEWGDISDGLEIIKILMNYSEVSQRSKEWGKNYLDQIRILCDFNDLGYNTTITDRIKLVATKLVKEYENPIKAASDKAALESTSFFLSKVFDETPFGKFFAVFSAGLSIAKTNNDIKDAMDAADLMYMVDCLIKTEYVAVSELERSYIKLLNTSVSGTIEEEDLSRLRNSAMLSLRINLRNRAFIYYLNTKVNKDSAWATSVQAKNIEREIFTDYTLLCELMETEQYDRLILLNNLNNIYCDEFGKIRQPIPVDIFHDGDIPINEFENDSIVNNGGTAVKINDKYYYWVYSGTLDNPIYSLIQEDEVGMSSEIYTSSISSPIYTLNNTIFINQRTSDYKKYWVTAINLSGDIKTIESVNICEVDPVTGRLILWSSGPRISYEKILYYVYDPQTEESILAQNIPEDASFLDVNNGIAYFQQTTQDKTGVILSSYNIKSYEWTELSKSYINYDNLSKPGEFDCSPCYIFDIQVTDYSIFYSYGFIGGTGHYLQAGGLARIDKSNFITETISEISASESVGIYGSSPKFYAFFQDGDEVVIYQNNDGDVVSTNFSTKTTIPSDMLLGLFRTPICSYDYEKKEIQCWLYPDADGEIVKILPDLQFGEHDAITYLEDVNYTGELIFYEVNHHKENSAPNSWRDYTITYHREKYVHNFKTGETRHLCSIYEE